MQYRGTNYNPQKQIQHTQERIQCTITNIIHNRHKLQMSIHYTKNKQRSTSPTTIRKCKYNTQKTNKDTEIQHTRSNTTLKNQYNKENHAQSKQIQFTTTDTAYTGYPSSLKLLTTFIQKKKFSDYQGILFFETQFAFIRKLGRN